MLQHRMNRCKETICVMVYLIYPNIKLSLVVLIRSKCLLEYPLQSQGEVSAQNCSKMKVGARDLQK